MYIYIIYIFVASLYSCGKSNIPKNIKKEDGLKKY